MTPSVPFSEKEITAGILGYWAESSETYSINHFQADGTYKAKTWKTKEKRELLYTTEGKWRVDNTTLYISSPENTESDEKSIYLVTSIAQDRLKIRGPTGTLELVKVDGFDITPKHDQRRTEPAGKGQPM